MEWGEVRKISLEFTGGEGPQTRPNTPHLIFKHPLVQNSTTDTKKAKSECIEIVAFFMAIRDNPATICLGH